MKYFLAEANQNTFILYDFLHKSVIESSCMSEVHASLCLENRDDALLLVDGKMENDHFSAQMLVLGLDGQLGEFCGNGSRACAAYLFKKFPAVKKCYLKTKYGKHLLQKHEEDIYSIKLPSADFKIDQKFIVDPQRFEKEYSWKFVNMIEPHLTLEGQMSDEELLEQGKRLNAQKDLFPLGINLNVWHVQSNGMLFVKTYERGVQRLTKSCGTGSLSCVSTFMQKGEVKVSTPGGVLDIIIDSEGIELKGPGYFRAA